MSVTLLERIGQRDCHVCVIGLGHVGLPVYRLAEQRGFRVSGIDIDEKKVETLIDDGVAATTDPGRALDQADCILICVPTPIDDAYRPDLGAVAAASKAIAEHLRKDSLVVLESTVAPGTTEEIVAPILMESGLRAGVDFLLAYCPERIDPGNERWPLKNIPRIVGGVSEASTDTASAFYRELLDADVLRMSSVRAAEATKIVENAFRDINIAFVNELAKSFDRIGIDVTEVIAGAATKPFGFMPHYPGSGVGGQCIAVDPYYLIESAGKSGFEHRFLKLAREINNSMPEYTVDRVILGLNEVGLSVKHARIVLLGLAYKGGVEDTRESPAFPIIRRLEELGAEVTTFDPYVTQEAGNLGSALADKDCMVLVTNHPEFKQISAELLKERGVRVVVDGRNILDKEGIERAGITYLGIGR